MAKKALIISGGGSKGAFAVGVLKYIAQNKPELKFDIIGGTSTGALITPLAAIDEISKLEEIYTSTTTEDIIVKGNLFQRFKDENSLFDGTPLKELVKKTVSNDIYNRIINSGKDIFLATVSLQTGKVTYFTNTFLPNTSNYDMIRFTDIKKFWKAIVASSNQPVFMPPIEIDGIQYVDGGVREYVPIQAAIAAGAEEIYAVLLAPEQMNSETKQYSSIPDILLRTIDLFSEDVSANDVLLTKAYSDGINYLLNVKQKMLMETDLTENEIDNLFNVENNPFESKSALKIHIIRPDIKLNSDGLEFTPSEMKIMLDKGFEIAEKYFREVPV